MELLGNSGLSLLALRRTVAAPAEKKRSVKDFRGHIRHSQADATADE